jgi:hypothetical protein
VLLRLPVLFRFDALVLLARDEPLLPRDDELLFREVVLRDFDPLEALRPLDDFEVVLRDFERVPEPDLLPLEDFDLVDLLAELLDEDDLRAVEEPPLRPPFFAGSLFSFLPRPEPLFLPPPLLLFTVAQARRSASFSETPRFS